MSKKFTVLILLVPGFLGFLFLQSQNVFSQANRRTAEIDSVITA